MSSHRTLGIVVNAAGIQQRRAYALVPHLVSAFDVEVLVRPSPRQVARSIGEWETLYVIDPGAAGFPAAAIAKSLGRTTVVEVGDPQRDLYAAQGRSKGFQLVGGALDSVVSKYADGVVVRGKGLVDTLGVAVPWAWIPDGVDLDQFQPTQRGDAIRDELAIPGDALVVGIVGSIQWSPERSFAYGLDVIDAVAQILPTNIHVLIVGDGTGLEHLKARAAALGLTDVHLPGRVPHNMVPHFIAAMDICVSTQSRDAIGHARTTAKLPEYLACDRFVLSTKVGTAARLLPPEMLLDTDFARWDDHVGQLSTRIAALLPLQSMLRRGAGTRALAVEHFSYAGLGSRLAEFLETCMRRRAASRSDHR